MTKFKKDIEENPSKMVASIAEIMAVAESHETHSASNCSNAGFENGDFTNWEVNLGYRDNCDYEQSTTDLSCFGFYNTTYANANAPNLTFPKLGERVEIIDKNTVSNLYDDFVGGTALPMVNLDGGDYSIRIENKVNGYGTTEITYTFTVAASLPYFEYHFAAVLEDPGDSHDKEKKPFFDVRLFDQYDAVLDCGIYFVVADEGDINYSNTNIYKEVPQNPGFKYCEWQKVVIPLRDYIGQTLTIKFKASDCPWGGHLGYAYIDGSCFDANIVQDSCLPDGTRSLSFQEGFDTYRWAGKRIIGPRSKPDVTISGDGNKFRLNVGSLDCIETIYHDSDPCTQLPAPSCDLTLSTISIDPCDAMGEYSVSGTVTINLLNYTGFKHVLVTHGSRQQVFEYVDGNIINFSFDNLPPDAQQKTVKAYLFKDLYFEETAALCIQSTTYTSPVPCNYVNFSCDCIGSFAPLQKDKSVHGQLETGKYVLSAWVKEDAALPTQIAYTKPTVTVNFYDANPNLPTPPLVPSYPLQAKGLIIDGWQRIEEEFEVPDNAAFIEIVLATSSGDAYFDDIRVYPTDGTMQSYVYDPVSLKLVATLDENNYATLYEYDQEGNLTRTKKETERGIITIQESRKATIKQ
jgi:hypothetical protein